MKQSIAVIFLMGIWILVIAIVAIVAAQNPTAISLQFLTGRSVLLPFGLLLTFSFLLGMGTGIWVWFLRS